MAVHPQPAGYGFSLDQESQLSQRGLHAGLVPQQAVLPEWRIHPGARQHHELQSVVPGYWLPVRHEIKTARFRGATMMRGHGRRCALVIMALAIAFGPRAVRAADPPSRL